MATENDKLTTVQKTMQLLNVNDDLGLPLKKAASVQNVMDLMDNYIPYYWNPLIQMYEENDTTDYTFSVTNLHKSDNSTLEIECNVNSYVSPQKSEINQTETNYLSNIFSFQSFKIVAYQSYGTIPLLVIAKKYISYTYPYYLTNCRTIKLNDSNDYTFTYENIFNNNKLPSGNQNTNISYLRIFIL